MVWVLSRHDGRIVQGETALSRSSLGALDTRLRGDGKGSSLALRFVMIWSRCGDGDGEDSAILPDRVMGALV